MNTRPRNLMDIQAEVVAWADEALPDRTINTMLLKMFEEMGEVVRNPRDPLQLADVLILLVDLADKHNIDLTRAVTDRMVVNKNRQWHINRVTGVSNHDRD